MLALTGSAAVLSAALFGNLVATLESSTILCHSAKIGLAIILYFGCWMIPAASIGYDRNSSRAGILNGVLTGIVLCLISILVMDVFLPRSQ